MTVEWLVLLMAKASFVLLSALAAAAMLRRSAASARHRLWTSTFVLVLAVPVLANVMPAISVTLPTRAQQALAAESHGETWNRDVSKAAPERIATVVSGDLQRAGLDEPDVLHGSQVFSTLSFVGTIWAIGCALALLGVVVSLRRVANLAKQSADVDNEAWQSSAREIGARFGMTRAPRLLTSERIASPMAGGILRPTVFLPIAARDWSDERREVVLTHEIAHLASRDPLRHVIARVAVSCYWFHPLAWMAAHRAAVSREQACDEAVLAAGTRPSAYARVLLDLSESFGATPAPLTALPMAQRSYLEKRLMAILNGNPRPSSAFVSALVAVGLVGGTLSAAAIRPSTAVTENINVGMDNAAIVDAELASSPVPAIIGLDPSSPEPQRSASRSSATAACRWSDGQSFSGSISTSSAGVTMRTGRSDSQMVVQRSFEGLRVCMIADITGGRGDLPTQVIDRASKVWLASERDGQTQEMEIDRASGNARATFRVNGRERQADAAVDEWKRSMLALLDNTWESSQIRGEESSLRGEISSIYGNESSLRGEISSIGGQVSSLRGEISSILGHESSLNGEISSIQGHLSSLRGAISSEQGAISSLNARRWDADAAEERRIQSQVAEHRKRIDAIEKEIAGYDADAKVREVRKQIESYNADAKVREVQKQIEAFSAAGKVEAVERQIADLRVDDKVRAIQQKIEALDADSRVAALANRQDDLLRRLRAAIAAIR